MKRLYVTVEAVVDAEDAADAVRRIANEAALLPNGSYDLTRVLSLAINARPTECSSIAAVHEAGQR